MRVEKARKRQYNRYQAQVTNAKIPFEKLSAASPLKESQLKMIRHASSKQQWSTVYKSKSSDWQEPARI
jgi:magnesium chelatase family protein